MEIYNNSSNRGENSQKYKHSNTYAMSSMGTQLSRIKISYTAISKLPTSS